jgi:hypothetical protein
MTLKFHAVVLSFLFSIGILNSAEAYTPPIGIPDPGIWGTTHPIDSKAPDTTIKCPNWPSAATIGCYYTDINHAQATDTNNTYGYPNKPRKTFPTLYAAGDYSEIHGGPYPNVQVRITANGTPEAPVWIRGSDADHMPIMTMETIIKGSYVILENLEYRRDGACLGLRVHNYSTLHHAVVRNCKFQGTGIAGSTSTIGISGSLDYNFNNIVIYNNDIFEMGDNEATSENDFHAIKPSGNSSYIWILNNRCYNMGGDSIQVSNIYSNTLEWPHHIYIGGNSGWGNYEDGVDIKQANHVIVSENTFHDMNGSGIVMHYNPTDVLVINNVVHDIQHNGIITTQSDRTYFIGNIVYNIKHDPAQIGWVAGPYANGNAIHVRGCSTDVWAINNTIWNCDVGIAMASGTGFHLYNNIIAGRSELNGSDLMYPTSDLATGSQTDNNLIYAPTGIRINWGGATYTSMASFKSGSGKCTSCLSTDPFFVDSTNNNFRLQSLSPAKDAGIEHSVYSTFETTYGISIKKDIGETLRPQGSAWDIGAYEELQFSGPAIKKVAPTTTF